MGRRRATDLARQSLAVEKRAESGYRICDLKSITALDTHTHTHTGTHTHMQARAFQISTPSSGEAQGNDFWLFSKIM